MHKFLLKAQDMVGVWSGGGGGGGGAPPPPPHTHTPPGWFF
jgi:hypothetical protein